MELDGLVRIEMTTTDIREVAAAEPFDADTDLVFGALSDADRRLVLAWLVDRRERVALADLAVQLAAWKRDTDADEVADSAVETTHAKLHHVHVPKLVDASLLSRDRDDGEVELAADAETLREHVDLPEIDA